VVEFALSFVPVCHFHSSTWASSDCVCSQFIRMALSSSRDRCRLVPMRSNLVAVDVDG